MIAASPDVADDIDRQQLEILQPDRAPNAPKPPQTQRHIEEGINARMADAFGWTDYRPATEPLDYAMFTSYLRQRGAAVECNTHTAGGFTTYTARIDMPVTGGDVVVTGGNHDDHHATAEIACCAAFLDLVDKHPEQVQV